MGFTLFCHYGDWRNSLLFKAPNAPNAASRKCPQADVLVVCAFSPVPPKGHTAPRSGREPIGARRPAVGAGFGTMCGKLQAGSFRGSNIVPADM